MSSSQPQQFGEYLLFRKLSTDPLGDVYRAGKIGGQGVERVVLLRMFNGQGVDRESTWKSMTARSSVHRALQNPHIGDGIDIGKIGDTPYVAYEYISGKGLGELLREARSKPFPIPLEQALFIAERATFGLTAAYATRFRDARIQHGFVVPEMIILSNEGEVRVLGFEAGPILRNSLTAAPVREAFSRYLPLEVGPGMSPTSSEDVFSLGAVLFELLTGQEVPIPADRNYEPVIDQAIVASEGTPIPPQIRALLKSSLTRKEERIADVQQFQQALSRFVSEGGHNPTTFNLAFFMHSLFKGEIERETIEIEKEKATQVDALLAEEAPAARPDSVFVPPEETVVSTSAEVAAPAPAVAGQYGAQKSGRNRWIGVLAAAGLVAGVGLAWYFLRGNSTTTPEPVATVAEQAAAQPAANVGLFESPATASAEDQAVVLEPVTPAEPSMTKEEMETQIRDLVEARAQEVEGALSARYEQELAQLRAQLEAAREVEDEPAEAAETTLAETVAEGPLTPPNEEESPEALTPEVAREAVAEPGSDAGEEAVASVPDPAAALPTQAEAVEPPAPEPVVEEQPELPKPELGDLITPGPEVVAPKILRRPKPTYPPAARRLNKFATVVIRVLVDENGRVVQAEPTGRKAGFGFDESALNAARRTVWEPATKQGVKSKMWVDLRIEFRP